MLCCVLKKFKLKYKRNPSNFRVKNVFRWLQPSVRQPVSSPWPSGVTRAREVATGTSVLCCPSSISLDPHVVWCLATLLCPVLAADLCPRVIPSLSKHGMLLLGWERGSASFIFSLNSTGETQKVHSEPTRALRFFRQFSYHCLKSRRRSIIGLQFNCASRRM